MVQGESVMRSEGMFGFDWGIYKGNNIAANADLNIKIEDLATQNVLRNRFDKVEALSGWRLNDRLIGDNRTAPTVEFDPNGVPVEGEFFGDGLDRAGVERITGMRQLLGISQAELNALDPDPIVFDDGNILIGGDGNDFMQGNGGNDIVDGDRWLNVRIKIVMGNGPNAGTYSAESLNSDTAVTGQNAGKVYAIDANGNPNFASVAFGGRTLTALLVDRTINPGQTSIVREILKDNTNLTGLGRNIDTAVFQGNMAEYDVEGSVDLNGDGDSNDEGRVRGHRRQPRRLHQCSRPG